MAYFTNDDDEDPTTVQNPGYIFTGSTGYNDLQQRRKIVEKMLAPARAYPKTFGEGLSAIGEALGDRSILQDLKRREIAQAIAERDAITRAKASVNPPVTAAPAAPTSIVATPPPSPPPPQTNVDRVTGTLTDRAASPPPAGQTAAVPAVPATVLPGVQRAPTPGPAQGPAPPATSIASQPSAPSFAGANVLDRPPPPTPVEKDREEREAEAIISATDNPNVIKYYSNVLKQKQRERGQQDMQNQRIWQSDMQVHGAVLAAVSAAQLGQTAPLTMAQVEKIRQEIIDARGKAEGQNLQNQQLQADLAKSKQLSDDWKAWGRDPEKVYGEFDTEKAATQKSVNTINGNRLALKALNEGIITGTLSDMRINLAKFRAFALKEGLQGDLASNTEVFKAAMNRAIGGAIVDIQGPGGVASNTDVKMAASTIGNDTNLEEKSIRAILSEMNRVHNNNIKTYEDKVEQYFGSRHHPQESLYKLNISDTIDPAIRQALLEHRNDQTQKDAFDAAYGTGAADLEIARAERREKKGGK